MNKLIEYFRYYSVHFGLPTGARYLSVGILFVSAFVPTIGFSNEAKAPLPKVLLVTNDDPSSKNDELFWAIQAQLSAAPLQLGRLQRENNRIFVKTLNPDGNLSKAAKLAADTDASMLFWVEDTQVCTTLYYLPDSDGGRFVERTLDLESSTQSTRIEYIAVAVASMVEKFLVTHQLVPPPAQVVHPREPAPVPPPAKKTWSKAQLSVAYSATWFAENKAQQGIHFGLQLAPFQRVAFGIFYTQSVPLEQETSDLQLSITSRVVGVSAGVKMVTAPIEVQAGVAYKIDLRSYSASARPQTFQNEHSGLKVVSAFSPYLFSTWPIFRHFGVFVQIGLDIAVNETTYKYTYDEVSTEMLLPHIFKLNGLIGARIIF